MMVGVIFASFTHSSLDTSSPEAKAAFAKSKGMAGCFTWSLDQDDGITLQNAIRMALGK